MGNSLLAAIALGYWTFGTALSLSVGAEYHVASIYSVRGGVRLGYLTGADSEHHNTLFSINGNPTPGIIRRDNNIDLTNVGVDLGVTATLSKRFELGFYGGLMYPLFKQTSAQELIESPSNVKFISHNASSREIYSEKYGGNALGSGFIAADARTSIDISSVVSLKPIVTVQLNLSEVISNSGLKPWSVTLGVAVALRKRDPYANGRAQKDSTVTRSELLVDTVTIIDPYSPTRKDTLWRQIESTHYDVVRGLEVDTTVATTSVRVERHLPSPAPFLASMLRVSIDSLVVDTVAVLNVDADVISDTSVTSVMRIDIDGQLALDRGFEGLEKTYSVRLADIVRDIRHKTEIQITVSMRSTDAYGRIVDALPRTVIMVRDQPGSIIHMK